MKWILSFAMTLFVFMATSSAVQAQTASTSEVKEASTITVKVKGVGCQTDIKTISENVQKLDGVSSCSVVKQGATTSFSVEYDADKVSKETIHATIEDTPGCKDPKDRPYKVKVT